MRNKILIPLVFIALVAGAINSVYATNSYMNTFNTTYGTASTGLNTCTLCHPSGTTTHNAYSTAFRNAGRNFRTIENSDSDGDGFTNIVEIQALTFPGNANSRPSSGDSTLPTVTNFVIPSTATSLTVAVTSFTATDNAGVTGYMVNESSTKPSASASGWIGSAPTSYTFSSAGAKTLYAWAKDAAGNVSASRSAGVTITLPDATLPTVTNFAIPTSSTSLTVAITTFTASDNVGVTGYLINESSTKPSASATGWIGSAPTSYIFSSAGTKTLYAWAKDAAGNVSASGNDSVTITLPISDTTRPTVTNFAIPSTSTSLTVPITTFTATDNVGVAGYLVTETYSAPSASATGWSSSAPASHVFATASTKTLYAWAKDAAGNVSYSRLDSVYITVSSPSADSTRPTVMNFIIPSTSTSLTVPITTFTASDNVGVTGYLITGSSTRPSASATGWSGSVPSSYVFTSSGTKTLYAWAKDAAGNVSASRNDSVTITNPPASQAVKILTEGAYGQYYSDPAKWVSAGYRVNIRGNGAALKAQAVDANGRKIAGSFSYRITSNGQAGALVLIDAQNFAYQKVLSLPLGQNYAYTVTVNGTSANGTIYSQAAKCDACHKKPEGHIADLSTWGACRSCHNLSNVTHKHVYKYGATFQCYTCHTLDDSNADVHAALPNSSGYTGFTCTECHGDLSTTKNNTFKTAAMAGLPSCASCHDANHSPPAAGVSFSKAVGHGGMLCISCHGSSHRIQKAMNLGTSGVNNCSSCHPKALHGGANCGECHGSSWDPHLVPRVR